MITDITETVTVAWQTATDPVSGSKFTSVQGIHSGGTQTSTLTVDSTEVTEDQAYTCRVTSGSFPESGHFDKTVNLNVYGVSVYSYNYLIFPVSYMIFYLWS